MGDAGVQWRRDLHDPIVLSVERQRAAHTAIRTDRIRLLLPGFIPRAGLAHIVFTLEHQSAGGTDTDAVAAINARRVGQRHVIFRRNVRVKSTPRDSNSKGVLRVAAAGLDAFVAKNAFRIIADVQIVIDLHRLLEVLGRRTVPLRMRLVTPDVRLRLRRRGKVDRRTQKLQNHFARELHAIRVRLDIHAGFNFSRTRRHQRARAGKLDHAHAADVDRREILQIAQRRRVDADRPAGVENRHGFGHLQGLPVDFDFDLLLLRPFGRCRRMTGWWWRYKPNGIRSTHGTYNFKFKFASADSIAFDAVWPRPQIDASRMA